jgi:hypothetical protein
MVSFEVQGPTNPSLPTQLDAIGQRRPSHKQHDGVANYQIFAWEWAAV